MMRSMFTAASGLRVHQGKMDIIGNNIANVNTIGFKKSQVSFQEVFSQVTQGATAPQAGKGGKNPQQVGMGISLGSVSTIHNQGLGQRTDNPTDLMIDGEGFFVVSSDPNFNDRYYTRAGNFSLDRDGNLVTAEGDKVLGYIVDDNENITPDITNRKINKSETKAPSSTKNIIFKGNLNSRMENGKKELIDTVIYDSLGNPYKITFEFTKGEGGSWGYEAKRITDLVNGNYIDRYVKNENGEEEVNVNWDIEINGKINFDNNGKINSDDISSVVFKIENDITFTHDRDGKQIPEGGIQKQSGEFSEITLFDPSNDETFKNITQYANEMSLKPFSQNGNVSGTLEGFAIDSSGMVIGSFTNGEKKILGQLVLAKFDNPMGLQKAGNNSFVNSRNSGEPILGKAGTNGLGSVSAGNLEMSNVDISLEFIEMITTQRGFQANSRIITTSDEMLQELANLKR